jgi:hypothetical protein
LKKLNDWTSTVSDYHSDDDDTRQRKSSKGLVDDMKEGFTKNMSSMVRPDITSHLWTTRS